MAYFMVLINSFLIANGTRIPGVWGFLFRFGANQVLSDRSGEVFVTSADANSSAIRNALTFARHFVRGVRFWGRFYGGRNPVPLALIPRGFGVPVECH